MLQTTVRNEETPGKLVMDPAKARRVTKAETATWDKPSVHSSTKVPPSIFFQCFPADVVHVVCVVQTAELEVHGHDLSGPGPV